MKNNANQCKLMQNNASSTKCQIIFWVYFNSNEMSNISIENPLILNIISISCHKIDFIEIKFNQFVNV